MNSRLSMYEEDKTLFNTTPCNGFVDLVVIIPYVDLDRWILMISSGEMYTAIEISSLSRKLTPLSVLVSGDKKYGHSFVRAVESALEDTSTFVFSMVSRNSGSRSYYILVPYSHVEGTNSTLFKKATVIEIEEVAKTSRVSSRLLAFRSRYVKHSIEQAFMIKDVCRLDARELFARCNHSHNVTAVDKAIDTDTCIDVDLRDRTTCTRAGVIPYEIVNGSVYVCLGISFTGKYTDFGGGFSFRDKSPIDCIAREVEEEAGHHIARTLTRRIRDNSDNATVFRYRRRSQRFIEYIVFVQVSLSSLKHFRKNSEVVAYSIVSEEDFRRIPREKLHPPIRLIIARFQSCSTPLHIQLTTPSTQGTSNASPSTCSLDTSSLGQDG